MSGLSNFFIILGITLVLYYIPIKIPSPAIQKPTTEEIVSH